MVTISRRALILIAVAIALLVVAGLVTVATRPTPRPSRVVTIDGSDGAGGIIDPINVWATYEPRGAVVAQLHPGAQVTMFQRVGDGVFIRTSDGAEGWITYWFITGLSH